MSDKLTADRLREVLNYDPDTGKWTWAISAGRKLAGDTAGTINGSGYIYIQVDGKQYRSHRLAWMWMTGSFPCGQVDHVNCSRIDNRWSNLRQADSVQNKGNSPTQRNNTSGIRGVSWNKTAKRWQASLRKNGKLIHLGNFMEIEDAAAAYASAALKHFGDFAHPSTRELVMKERADA